MLVREDLPFPHRVVQSCHAVLAATNSFGSPKRTHPHLVLCGVPDEESLEKIFNDLKDRGVPCCGYYEPDFEGNQLTAVATAPLVGEERKPLRKFPLLK